MKIEVKETKFKIGDVLYYYDSNGVRKYVVVGFHIDGDVFADNVEEGTIEYLLLEDGTNRPNQENVEHINRYCFKTRKELLEFHKKKILE